ncbi:MAG: [LysW]-lysine hydrolase [Chloroflexi bacterium]|nr:[LysW]-lysine hydrolase [Chloroflexota bacterium]
MTAELLVELVKRYSPSCHEAPAVTFLVEWMREQGFDAWIDSAGNACGQRGPQDAPHTIMLLGHIDTVAGEIPVRIDDGVLYGRGSVDAKGPLSTFAEAAARAQLPAGWRVLVVGAVEEEAPTSKGAHYIRDRYTPDMCIIGEPSGADRITLGYKGHLMMDYTLSRPVAHSSRPDPTVAELGIAFWNRVQMWVTQQNQHAKRQFDAIVPHLLAMHTHSDGFWDTVDMTLSFRLPPAKTIQEVRDAVFALIEPDARVRPYSAVEAYRGEKNNALVRGMLAAIRAQGQQPGFVVKGGTSDMNVVGPVWSCPIVAYGPGDSALDHTPTERLPLCEYTKAVNTLQHVLEHLEENIRGNGR